MNTFLHIQSRCSHSIIATQSFDTSSSILSAHVTMREKDTRKRVRGATKSEILGIDWIPHMGAYLGTMA